jgi:sugar phosphate isomerase/epimerase
MGMGLMGGVSAVAAEPAASGAAKSGGLKLGMVTYNMGKDMDCPALIKLCKAAHLEGVELRTGHKHGVEPSLDKSARADVKKLFADSGIAIAGLGTTCEFHAKEADEVKKNIEDAKAFAQLAADIGALGIKVRPNGLYKDEPVEKTCERIGKAWGEVAAFGANLGIPVRMEVHGGGGSALPVNVRKMLDAANHPNAFACWNSNASDMDDNKSIKASFELLKHAIGEVHITDIGVYQYPWQELFDLLKGIHYGGFCNAEIKENDDPERFMKYYRTLFDLYTGQYHWPVA